VLIDLLFSVEGNRLASDHNYFLYSAIVKALPICHDMQGLAINTITGIPDKQGEIRLGHLSKLLIRTPIDYVQQLSLLLGQKLRVGKYYIALKNASICQLKPANKLCSRIVIIKNCINERSVLNGVNKELESLNVNGVPVISDRKTLLLKKPTRTYTIVGYSVILSELSDSDSITIQQHGIGGKRRIGCGVFVQC